MKVVAYTAASIVLIVVLFGAAIAARTLFPAPLSDLLNSTAVFLHIVPRPAEPSATEGSVSVGSTIGSLWFGSTTEAETQAQALVSSTPVNTPTHDQALGLLASAKFATGQEDKRIEAVDLTKAQYLRPDATPQAKAYVLDTLIGYNATALEPHVIDEVFAGAPFNSFLVPGDMAASDKNMAERSIALYPTSQAYVWVGVWHASQILQHVDGTKKLSSAAVEEHVAAIKQDLALADQSFAAESKLASSSPVFISQLLWHQQFFGFLVGAIALVHPEYLPTAESWFKAILSRYEAYRQAAVAATGKEPAALEALIPYTRFSDAVYIYKVGGEKRKADAVAQLDDLVTMIKAHPDTHAGAFTAFLQQTATVPDTDARWFSPKEVRAMASISPAFKALLVEDGWQF